MVNPAIYIIAVPLAVAFLLAIIDKHSRKTALAVFTLSLVLVTFFSGFWLYNILLGHNHSEMVYTAGFKPPYSINLQLGIIEAIVVFLINATGLLGAVFLWKRFKEEGYLPMALFLMAIMGAGGIVMTRDLFNLFVFIEILSIATYALIAFDQKVKSLAAGFKYMIAGGLASMFLLIGVIYIYRLTGTLNIDSITSNPGPLANGAGFTALFLLVVSLLIELKPFPANGWALDVYESANSGIGAIIAVVNSAAMFFAFYKIFPMINVKYMGYIAAAGLVTFVFSNLTALKQDAAKRLLGYSSIGQMGLLIAVMAILERLNATSAKPLITKTETLMIIGGIFISHFFAKAGLFWLTGIVKKEKIKEWSALWNKPALILFFGVFVFALSGLPPFPAFWAKWQLIIQLIAKKHIIYNVYTAIILIGSLLEAWYLIRWFGYSLHKNADAEDEDQKGITIDYNMIIPVAVFGTAALVAGVLFGNGLKMPLLSMAPVFGAILLLAIDDQPARLKGILTMAIIGTYVYFVWSILSGITLVFGAMFLIGGFIIVGAGLYKGGDRKGYYPWLLMLILSLGSIVTASRALEFFFAWELMTLSSYLLVTRGEKSREHSLKYILFSLVSAFMIMVGMAIMSSGDINLFLEPVKSGKFSILSAYGFLLVGFLIKSAALGFHIWLPGAYAEAEDDFSALISSVVSKAGIFGLIIFTVILGHGAVSGLRFNNIDIPALLGWIGVLTALFGALMASFQEDAKYLLAWSSMSQLGYIILAYSAMSHLGWVTATYLALNHFLFKALLFLAIAGVILRTKTRLMYKMGGLIGRMPFSFVSVLIGIIAVSGVPPLSGFGGKWLLYNTLVNKGWYLHAGLAFFASTIAFLYLFRLIFVIFLGQAKAPFKDVKEAPLTLLIPQYIMIMGIMALSTFPSIVLKPVSAYIDPYFATTLQWKGLTAVTPTGYWNATMVMTVTMIVFASAFVWLFIMGQKLQKVKQFNIVYAAERPFTPETTHYAHNFYSPYFRSLGFLTKPVVTTFWNRVSEGFHSTAGAVRSIYNGNGQTYSLFIVLYVIILYFMMRGF